MVHRIVVSLCAWLVLVAPAAATSFKGQTSQQRHASGVTGPDGLVTRIRIGYSAPCTDPRYRFPNTFRFEAPFKRASVDAVTDSVQLSTRLEGGGRSHQTASVTAHFDGHSWSGTFK